VTSGTALRTFKFYRHADSFLGDGVETGVCQPTDWVLSPCFSEHRRSGWLIGLLTVRFRLDRLSLLRVSPGEIGFPDLSGSTHPNWINAGLFFPFIDVVCFPLGSTALPTIYTNEDFEDFRAQHVGQDALLLLQRSIASRERPLLMHELRRCEKSGNILATARGNSYSARPEQSKRCGRNRVVMFS
jgi:hypothetical protein